MECPLPPRPEDLNIPVGDSRGGGAYPKVLLGDPVTGAGGDSTRTGFAKYNVHDHFRASGRRFDTTGIQVGDTFEMALQGVRVFPPGTQVVEVRSEELVLSNPALCSGDAPALVYGDVTIRVPNVRARKDSPVVVRVETAGMVEGAWLEALAPQPFNRWWDIPTEGLYALCLWLPFRGALSHLVARLHQGTLRLSPWANGRPLGREILVGPEPRVQTYPWPLLPNGSRLEVRIASPNNARGLEITCIVQRLLT